jgi:hypothetical protein
MPDDEGTTGKGGKEKKPKSGKLDKDDLAAMIVTVVLLIALIVLAWLSYDNDWKLGLALSVGGVGGLIHEIAQSGGKFLLVQKKEDGLYLGSYSGVILGAVAGILTLRGLLNGDGADATNNLKVVIEVFLAGLALKGVVEAAGGKDVPEKSESEGKKKPQPGSQTS